VRIGFRRYLLDAEDTLYRVPIAAFDRMLRDPVRHRLPRFAGQRLRSAEIAVALMNGKPIAVERSSFSILTFKKNGTLVSPLLDSHVRARAELALALGQPRRDTAVADASTRFLARGGQWSPSPAVRRRIEQTALGRREMSASLGPPAPDEWPLSGTQLPPVSAIGCRSLIGTECRRAAIGREAPDNTDDSTYSNCQEKLTWQIGTASVIDFYLLPRPTAKKLTTEK